MISAILSRLHRCFGCWSSCLFRRYFLSLLSYYTHATFFLQILHTSPVVIPTEQPSVPPSPSLSHLHRHLRSTHLKAPDLDRQALEDVPRAQARVSKGVAGAADARVQLVVELCCVCVGEGGACDGVVRTQTHTSARFR